MVDSPHSAVDGGLIAFFLSVGLFWIALEIRALRRAIENRKLVVINAKLPEGAQLSFSGSPTVVVPQSENTDG